MFREWTELREDGTRQMKECVREFQDSALSRALEELFFRGKAEFQEYEEAAAEIMRIKRGGFRGEIKYECVQEDYRELSYSLKPSLTVALLDRD